MFVSHSSVHLVFDLMDSDLEKVIKDERSVLTEPMVKAYSLSLLRAVSFLHSRWILHRDIKPSNLLISWDPVTRSSSLKLSDFGLCRPFADPDRRMTSQAVTRWYRPPELLMGADKYGAGVDLWSCGCVIAELFLRVPLFAGDTELDQLAKIFEALGTPTEATWPGVSSLPGFLQFTPSVGTPMRAIFPAVSDAAIALISRLLSFRPQARGTAQQAIEHPFFTSGQPPCAPNELPRPPMKAKRVEAPTTAADTSEPRASRRRFQEDGEHQTAAPDPVARNKFLEQLESLDV